MWKPVQVADWSARLISADGVLGKCLGLHFVVHNRIDLTWQTHTPSNSLSIWRGASSRTLRPQLVSLSSVLFDEPLFSCIPRKWFPLDVCDSRLPLLQTLDATHVKLIWIARHSFATATLLGTSTASKAYRIAEPTRPFHRTTTAIDTEKLPYFVLDTGVRHDSKVRAGTNDTFTTNSTCLSWHLWNNNSNREGSLQKSVVSLSAVKPLDRTPLNLTP